MEKTTKKRKKSKRLKRRIGLIAVGGLSFVLTICLSVGATLAWFAGSTWASNDLYMGGPVYVEMAGRGENGYTTGTDDDTKADAVWQGGSGTLDIKASARDTGTADGQDSSTILLPGQKLLVYSQARVYSTLQESTVDNGARPNQSSGADNSNMIKNGSMTYYDGTGRVQTTTTSVLRAKFSINIEFDPSVGFNNFTDKVYAQGYPVQSANYRGEYGAQATGTSEIGTESSATDSYEGYTPGVSGGADTFTKKSLTWDSSLGKTPYAIERETSTEGNAGEQQTSTTVIKSKVGRRDAVAKTKLVAGTDYVAADCPNVNTDVYNWVDGSGSGDLWQVKWGISKLIYKWKYVSQKDWLAAGGSSDGTGGSSATAKGIALGAPFNGKYNTAGGPSAAAGGVGNGFYAIIECINVGTAGEPSWVKAESDAYYNARTAAYLNSYVEHYVDEYNRNLMLTVQSSLGTLETALNDSFIDLVNQSSDNIYAGNVMGFSAGTDGRISYDQVGKPAKIQASWLYVDPVIGNDTNAADGASSVGGWWYLVATDDNNKSSGDQTIITQIDNVVALSKGSGGTAGATGATTADSKGVVTYKWLEEGESKNVADNTTSKVPADAYNNPIEGVNFKRFEDDATTGVKKTDKQILTAKLYEITPNLQDKLIATAADGTTTTKVVSYAFPFVNGNFELPGQAMTNIFANAKISFQITFQALQAFFPFSQSIDSIPSGTAITGTGKALNIGNSIPIFNEAFDYLGWL